MSGELRYFTAPEYELLGILAQGGILEVNGLSTDVYFDIDEFYVPEGLTYEMVMELEEYGQIGKFDTDYDEMGPRVYWYKLKREVTS